MNLSPELITLGKYLTGEFDNKTQALAEPAWYVHLRLWMRPVALFAEDSITLYAEQASIVNINQPYRPRLLRLVEKDTIQIQYYMFKNINEIVGAGQNSELLQKITPEKIEFLPNCTLQVTTEQIVPNQYKFTTSPVTETPCSFCYQGKIYQVFLGFEATESNLQTFDKGINPETGEYIWGALLGPYKFQKILESE